MSGISQVVFVHEGKAAYPEVSALRSWLAPFTATAESKFADLSAISGIDRSVCWCMMGFYRNRPPARLLIHDYRSLSVGRLGAVKDGLKGAMNARPDLRIFQNEAIRARLGFRDGVASAIVPMGVPAAFLDRVPAERRGADFIYIGSLLKERRCERMLESFVRRYGRSKTFHLYGAPVDELAARFADHPNIRFFAPVPQAELKPILAASGAAVCYFPAHRPHVLQTPTKLLEYAALGMRIIANEHPQSRKTAEAYGMTVLWGDTHDMFARAPDDISWGDNAAVDPQPLAWPNVIARSGIEMALIEALNRRD
jgi:glycosyltransferase involved in cell wall biosynthesis